MAVILDTLRRKLNGESKRQLETGPDLEHDIQRENIETPPPDDRLNNRPGFIMHHIKKTWSELKSLKHKF
jgi:hypothetical protein